MKTLLTIIILCSICTTATVSQTSVTPLYLHINSHNEETDTLKRGPMTFYYDTDSAFYNQKRVLLKELADSVILKKVKWNWQSDWRYLVGAMKYDRGNGTSGKTIVNWMDESPFIEADPHAHETFYNYADVAHLFDSLGVTNRGNVGGYTYNAATAGKDWQLFENGLTGKKYPWVVWKPNVLWGGSFNGNHSNDLRSYGAWRPKSIAEFFTDDPTKRVTSIGNGCSERVEDTTDIKTVVDEIVKVVQLIETGKLPPNKFYTANVMFNQRDLSPTIIAKLCAVIDSLKPYVTSGRIVWANISEKLDTFKLKYASAPNFYPTCDDLTGLTPELTAPTLTAPMNNATNLPINLTLTWQGAAGASGYQVQISTNAGFTTILSDKTVSLTESSTGTLAPNTKYYWRVQAFSGSLRSPWSEVRNFTTMSISAVEERQEIPIKLDLR